MLHYRKHSFEEAERLHYEAVQRMNETLRIRLEMRDATKHPDNVTKQSDVIFHRKGTPND